MSQYIEFYVRNNDSFTNILSFSRNSLVYEALNTRVPYEKIRKLNSDTIHYAISETNEEKEKYQNMKAQSQARIAEIRHFNNSVEDKLEAIHNEEDNLEELDDLVKECEEAVQILGVLEKIVKTIDLNIRYEDVAGAQGLYAGIEAYKPTVDDIKESES